MKTIPLQLCFKGERNYLQGADLYSGVTGYFHNIQSRETLCSLHLAFHGFARRQAALAIAEHPSDTKPEKAVSDFAISSDAGKRIGWLVETDQEVPCRNPFPEERIHALCTVDGQSVRIASQSGFSPIEELVSMTKLLHNQLFPFPGKRWIFSRIDLERLLTPFDAGRMSVSLQQNLNNRVTKSRILADGAPIGDIFFSLI